MLVAGYGHHHQRWTSASGDGNVSYDDYDYGSYGYTGAAAEHYVSCQLFDNSTHKPITGDNSMSLSIPRPTISDLYKFLLSGGQGGSE